MFTLTDFIFGSITHTAIHQAKIDQLRSKNVILPSNIFKIIKIIGTDSAIFYIDENIDKIITELTECSTESDLIEDIRPTDNVLDIGGIGAFSLHIHRKVNRVYIVDPLMIDSLKKNIDLNNAKNITIINTTGYIPISTNSTHTSTHISTYISTPTKDLFLEEILKLTGDKIDIIKSEYPINMKLPDILNVRKIYIKINSYKLEDFENLIISSGFDYRKKLKDKNILSILAKNRYIS